MMEHEVDEQSVREYKAVRDGLRLALAHGLQTEFCLTFGWRAKAGDSIEQAVADAVREWDL